MKTTRYLSILTLLWILTGTLSWSQESTKEELNIPLSNPGQPGKLECSLVNGGGPEYYFKSAMGDIYFRKK